MAAFKLRRQIEARGARLVLAALRFRDVLPYGRMQARLHRTAHQRMPCGMEFGYIETLAARTVGLQLRRIFVRHTRQLLRFGRRHVTAKLIVFLADDAIEPTRQIDQKRIGAIGIDAGPGRRLVQFGEFFFGAG
ncbi:hypothetical protein D3C73_655190 [compost metagenome]